MVQLFLSTLIVLQFIILLFVVDIEEDRITELEYNLSVSQTALLICTTPLPPLESPCK